MSDEQNLTFVGGKAIEQHESLDSNVDAETRSEAMDAVREAIKNAGKEAKDSAEKASKQDPYKPAGAKDDKDDQGEKSPVVKKPAKTGNETPERGPDGKFLPKEGKGNDEGNQEEDSEPDTSLKRLLKHRQDNAAPKKEAQDRFAKERAEIEAKTKEIQQVWAQIQQEQARIQRERERFEKLRRDPAAAIREVGWEPEQFIVDLARDGTPEGQAARQQRELQQQLQEMKEWRAQQERNFQEAQQRQHWEQQAQYRQHIIKTFTEDALNEELRPHTAAVYKGRESALMDLADRIAQEYRDLSGGKEASLKEVADFIEEELAERLNGWYDKRTGTKVAASDGAKPGKGSKGKSLTPEAASESRSLGRKGLKDLDEEERKAAAKAAVAAALETD